MIAYFNANVFVVIVCRFEPSEPMGRPGLAVSSGVDFPQKSC